MAGLVVVVAPATPAGSEGRSQRRTTYIVQLATTGLASSDGPIRALDAERVRRFDRLLERSERRALSSARAGRAPVLHRYRRAFAGFTARLTPAEADALARTSGVAAVTPDPVYHLEQEPRGDRSETSAVPGRDTATLLDLSDGIWARVGGAAHAGEGVTIGVIDTGIYPEHPSFAARPGGASGAADRRYNGPPYAAPAGWKGACQGGEQWAATTCNAKLVGARWFVDGFGARNVASRDFLSPRDANGHGTHVAAIAAGNHGVKPVIGGRTPGVAAVTGVAPRARIAVYKICWTPRSTRDGDGDGICMGSDAVAAIDAAVADGVDIINYSVGNAHSARFGPVERAFLEATQAGVFVANAAGNHGPKAGTIGSPTGVPWVTAVAATTAGRADGSGPAARERVASFSSRGPDRLEPDIAKPDLAAPGVGVLAADTPTPAFGRRGETFRIASGTSMASPGVAGAAALLRQLHPDWSAAAIRSALMTTAWPGLRAEDGRRPAGPLDVGAGRLDPNRAAAPGLIVDTPVDDYRRFLQGQVPGSDDHDRITALAAGDLNLPSVAFSQFGEAASTVRTFTSVDRFRQTWRVTVESPPGVTAEVRPARFHIRPGASRAVTLSLRRAAAAPGRWTWGALVLTNTADGRRVRLPVTVQPVER